MDAGARHKTKVKKFMPVPYARRYGGPFLLFALVGIYVCAQQSCRKKSFEVKESFGRLVFSL
jgi:hypothetical protein